MEVVQLLGLEVLRVEVENQCVIRTHREEPDHMEVSLTDFCPMNNESIGIVLLVEVHE